MDALGFNSLPPIYTPTAEDIRNDANSTIPSLPPVPSINTQNGASPRINSDRQSPVSPTSQTPIRNQTPTSTIPLSSSSASFESSAARLAPQFPSTPSLGLGLPGAVGAGAGAGAGASAPGMGTRTISAAAFRRVTPNRSPTSGPAGDALEMGGGGGKRGLPSGPVPEDYDLDGAHGYEYDYYPSQEYEDARGVAGTPTPGQRGDYGAAPGGRVPVPTSPAGYASGRFATKLE